MTGRDSGSLWEWFAARLRAAPAREPLPLSTIRFLQASLLAQDGQAQAAVGVTEQVLADRGLPPLMRSVAHSLRAAQLIALGHLTEAIAAAQAATDAARRLDRANPGSAAVLARALAGEAMMVVQTRRFAEALALSEEAVRVARTCPPAEDGPLAPALDALVAALTSLDRAADALPAAEEVVAIRRWHGRPDQLASALGHLAGLHARTGDPERALLLADESLSIARAVERPDAHVLGALADAAREAVAVLRRASADPARDDRLATALHNLTSVHLRTGRYADAVVAATEAVEIRERLHEADPAQMTPTFASTVSTLAEAFLKDGKLAEARAMVEWAEELRSPVGASGHEG